MDQFSFQIQGFVADYHEITTLKAPEDEAYCGFFYLQSCGGTEYCEIYVPLKYRETHRYWINVPEGPNRETLRRVKEGKISLKHKIMVHVEDSGCFDITVQETDQSIAARSKAHLQYLQSPLYGIF